MKNIVLALTCSILIFSCKWKNKNWAKHLEKERITNENNQFKSPQIISSLKLSDKQKTSFSLEIGDYTPLYIGQYRSKIEINNLFFRTNEFEKYLIECKYIKTEGNLYKSQYAAIWDLFCVLKIDTTQKISSIYSNYSTNKNDTIISYPVNCYNFSNDTIIIGANHKCPFYLEAKNKKGEWQKIENLLEGGGCATGNRIITLILPPKNILVTSLPIYKGDFKTKIRLKFSISNIVSNEIDGTINESQF